jgi:valyl-tRNA synthetase
VAAFHCTSMEAVHPDDLERYPRSNGDLGWWLIGNDCAGILGMEWTVPEVSG